ncbi:hypothetical protein C0J52_20908 [Blattella germanica]|nr:hypothetical protein C0J52_20908 [Blattella germanica]
MSNLVALWSEPWDENFIETPQDSEVKIGDALLLKCRVNETVEECNWSWKALDDKSGETLTAVKAYPPFGDNHTDCSVRFNEVLLEQEGYWIFDFSEVTRDTIFEAGQQLLLNCKTQDSVKECQWTWKPLQSDNMTELVVKTFTAFGNESQDCSIRLNSVLPEQAGFWSCGARNTDGNYTLAPAIKLTVRKPQEVEFSEVTYDTEIGVGKPLLLTCKTIKPVEECQWTWKSDKAPAIVMKQFQSFGNDSRDCSLRFDNVASEQEGIWTCAARYEWQTTFTAAHPLQLTVLTDMNDEDEDDDDDDDDDDNKKYDDDNNNNNTNNNGVAFVQLSQDIQVSIGEPILLRCVTNTGVELCQWSWQPLNRTNETAVVVKQFPAFGEEGRDCSVRFKSVLEEQEGIWICSIRLYAHSPFITASPPATVSLLPAVRLKFLERPEDIRVAIGETAVLRCIATSSVNECVWTWRPLTEPNKTELVVKRFPAFGNHSRDCSVRFRNVLREQEGLWGCTVIGPPNHTQLAASPAKLTVFDPGRHDYKFPEVWEHVELERMLFWFSREVERKSCKVDGS